MIWISWMSAAGLGVLIGVVVKEIVALNADSSHDPWSRYSAGGVNDKGNVIRVVRQLLAVLDRHMGDYVPPRLYGRFATLILRAGKPLNINGREVVFLCALSAVTGGLAGAGIGAWLGIRGIAPCLCGCLGGGYWPVARLGTMAAKRQKEIRRGLPFAIELIALCLKAGLGFPTALINVSNRLKERHPLKEELQQVVSNLRLGMSRETALSSMADRIGLVEMHRFVAAVNRSEKTGAPLSTLLSIQATTMRERRTQLAEQAAARAGILLLGPLMLIFSSVFLLLLGPFIVQMVNGQLM